MIQLRNISLAYGEQKLFSNISALFNSKQHIGVVGRNGAGKSTLLKIIAGDGTLDEGSVSIERNKTIVFMPQDLVFASTKTVFDETFSAFAELSKLLEEKKVLEVRLEHEGPDQAQAVERYSHVQEELRHYNVFDHEARAEKMLIGLGFAAETMRKLVSTLSVGWQMRIVLAKLLLQDADFYLFDEPTNHLDIVSKEWFLEFLKNAPFGFLLVTHDRYFLEHACNYIFELERGNGRLFTGTLTTYLALKEQEAAIKMAAYTRQQKEITSKQATIDRFRASASKSRMAQSMIKQLAKIEVIEPDPVMPHVSFHFPTPVRAGDVVLSFKNLQQKFLHQLIFDHISGELRRGEKVAIVAPNGVGKTTLFNLLVGLYPHTTGSITFGYNVKYAYFEQDQTRALTLKNTVFEEVAHSAPKVIESRIRKMLGSFLFTGDDVDKKIDMLSGGERCRVALAKLLLQDANFLLLDEPTNHLDIYAKEVLLQALQQYQGTILFVSHDHDFVQRLATRILELTPNLLASYQGTYEAYLERKKLESKPGKTTDTQRASSPQEQPATKPNKELYVLKKEVSSLENKIVKLERQIDELTISLGYCEYGSEQYHATLESLKEKQKTLSEASTRWEALIKAS